MLVIRDGGASCRPIIQGINDKRIRFIDRDKNLGLGKTYNEAYESIPDDHLVCYLGDDDYIYPDHVATLVKTIEDANWDCIGAYSDLMKTFYGDEGRIVSKNLEISRSFNRAVMLNFSHILGGSVMHPRWVYNLVGSYDDELPMLLDCDFLRQASMYGNFIHVPKITGEYTSLVNIYKSDRLSAKQVSNPGSKKKAIQRIQTKRPRNMDKSRIALLKIIIATKKMTKPGNDLVANIEKKTYYPSVICQPDQCIENVWAYIRNAIGSRPTNTLVAFVSPDYTMGEAESPWIEHLAYPLGNDFKISSTVYYSHRKGNLFPLFIFDARSPQFSTLYTAINKLADEKKPLSELNYKLFENAGYVMEMFPKEMPYEFDQLALDATGAKLRNEYNLAATIYERMVNQYPENHIPYRQKLAECYFKLGEYQKANEHLMVILEQEPTPAAYVLAGLVAEKSNKTITDSVKYFAAAKAMYDYPYNRL